MRARPILFSSAMVRAILAGKKTVTRRIVKPQPHEVRIAGNNVAMWGPGKYAATSDRTEWLAACPYGVPGDRLWVRETWQRFDPDRDPIPAERFGPRAPFTGLEGGKPVRWTCCYAADGPLSHPTGGAATWRPSIHMPRWASRITLEVTGVRVERVQEISEEDAQSEGVGPTVLSEHWTFYEPESRSYPTVFAEPPAGSEDVRHHPAEQLSSARDAFASLWDSINGKRAPWSSNVWVWCVSFRRMP